MLTILTPTYNRAHTLGRLYKSLQKQTDKNFIWIIIDDGSTDVTKELIMTFDDSIQIIYQYKENGGKHTAINYGMQFVTTDYVFVVDSDDYLLNTAVEKIDDWIQDPRLECNKYAGVAGTRCSLSANGKIDILGEFPEGYEVIETTNALRQKYRLSGDKAEVYKTKVLKQFPFPEFEGEKFLPEGVVWNKIAEEGLIICWHKQPLLVCEYQRGGLTDKNKDPDFIRKNFRGISEAYKQNWRVLPYPWNYSSAAHYLSLCKMTGNEDKLREYINPSIRDLILIKFIYILKKIKNINV